MADQLTAELVPYSSVTDQSIMLTDKQGAVVAIVGISVPRPSLDYKTTALPIAEKIVAAFNDNTTAGWNRAIKAAAKWHDTAADAARAALKAYPDTGVWKDALALHIEAAAAIRALAKP